MKNLLNEIETALKSLDYPQRPEGLYEPIEYILSAGGKRIRPTLALLAYSLYRNDFQRAMPAALALEIYHNHTLLHDDLMDNADVRHGMPTVHRRWNANTAVLSGDTMLIMAFRKAMQTDCPRKEELLQVFAQTMQEVCEGQQYDVNFESRNDVSVDEYLEMIRLKTSVLLACALKMGALAADAPAADAQQLYRFGELIGLAFQLQDDYLDCYGDPAVFGKSIGGDILCGKKTFLLTTALQRATPQQHAQLLAAINGTNLDNGAKIKRVLELYEDLNIPQLCHERIETLYSEAETVLSQLPLPAERKQPLYDFARRMLKREK